MVRFLIKSGRKIKLLPAISTMEVEDEFCQKCGNSFGPGDQRRACFEICGHLACLGCLFQMENGCEFCKLEASDAEIEDEEENVNPGEKQQVLVLSSVLSKSAGEEEDDVFPEIQRLSLSALPVLECANEPPIYELEEEDEEDEEFERQFAADLEKELENQKQIQEQEIEDDDIPVIDLSADEIIPVIDLLSDEEDDDVFEGPSIQSTCTLRQPETMPNKIPIPIDTIAQESSVMDTPPLTPEEESTSQSSGSQNIFQETTEQEIHGRSLRKRRKSQCFPKSDSMDVRGFGIHTCNYCGSTGFVDKRALGRHLCQEHWDIKPFPCKICDWPFETQRQLDKHMLIHSDERPFKCNQCDASFKSKYTLEGHLEGVHKMVLKKSKNKVKRFKKDKLLATTENDSSPKNSKIPVNTQIHDEVDEDYTPIMTYTSSHKVKNAQTNFVENENDEDISNEFMKSPRKQIASRKRGQKTQSQKNANSDNKFICCHCSEEFIGKTRLGNHLREIHADKRPYSCDICGWSFAQKNKLALHRITHTIDRPHKCKQCDATFNRKYSLERHVRIMHLKKPRISEAAENKPCQRKGALCPYCQERFDKEELGFHLQREHQEKRPHVCTQCQWPFARRKHLVAHMRTHSQERPYSCSMCESTFNRRFSLERHMEHVHGIRIRLTPEETPVGDEYCPECQSLFGTVDCQKVAYSECGHISCIGCVIRAELGCGQCTTENAPRDGTIEEELGEDGSCPQTETIQDDEIFTENSVESPTNLDDNKFQENIPTECHIIQKIMENENSEILKISEKIKSPKEKRKKMHTCKYCQETYPEKRELGIHLQYFHRDIRPFSCDICQWPFSSMRDLERHQVVHTKQRHFICQTCSASFNRKSVRDRHMDTLHRWTVW